MKKLLLIQPVPRSIKGKSKHAGRPPLSLQYIAAFTPENWQIKIVDEDREQINFDKQYDLVGITSITSTVTRAYAIADKFRGKNIPVVLGGMHVSMCPDEALYHADSVVIGHARSVWIDVLDDVQNGQLKKKYWGNNMDLNNLEHPRRDLTYQTDMDFVLSSTGCPFKCEFCSVHNFYNGEYRQRPVNDILDELQAGKTKRVFFTDDNLLGKRSDRKRAIELFKGMIDRKLNKIWGAQASLNIAKDDELLKLAQKSGCRVIYVGIESVNNDTLKQMNKVLNVKAGEKGIREAVNNIHKHKIAVIGGIIFGNDHDDKDIFDRMLRFIEDVNLDSIDPTIIAPYPGTKLFERISAENRLIYNNFPEDWEKYNTFEYIIYQPKKLSLEELSWGFNSFIKEVYSVKKIFQQFLKTLYLTKSPIGSIAVCQNIISFRRFFEYSKLVKDGKNKIFINPHAKYPGMNK